MVADSGVGASAAVLAELTRPSAAYRKRAWGAMAGLLAFMAAYIALTGWFAWTAYRFGSALVGGHQASLVHVLGAVGAAFMAVFMLKAMFFRQAGAAEGLTEITEHQQPELFQFLRQLADTAGAPRPHRVYVSARVNAGVFYDLSLLNLLFPSRKNLEIGLGLVNALSLGEFRAVLAHEFGHFAQRSMAIGRWVYVAQQVAGQLVTRRDRLDAFLSGLSRTDPRIAWVGWLLGIMVWAIRTVVDAAFRVVVAIQRALSREMEMNADLVAVSVTGSDALIHALHRLQAADDAWGRAAAFALTGKAQGRATPDLFAVQTAIAGYMRRLLNDPLHGEVPPQPSDDPSSHRLFKPALAQPPRMWLSHPLNHEREANAKRRYIAAGIDARSSWVLFQDALALRRQVTDSFLGQAEVPPESEAATLEALRKDYERESFDGSYHGIYFGRNVARYEDSVESLFTPDVPLTGPEALYPPTLARDIEQLRALEAELAQLRALHEGTLQAPGDRIQHRGRPLKRAELPGAIAGVEADLRATGERLQAHDRQCRAFHMAAAQRVGKGWPQYLRGLMSLVHYAEHSEAHVRDLHAGLGFTVRRETAGPKRRLTDAQVQRILDGANQLTNALVTLYADAARVSFDASLQATLGVDTWAAALGTLGLPQANRNNLAEWMNAVDGWVRHTVNACLSLKRHALDALLRAEAVLRSDSPPEDEAPPAAQVPEGYATLRPGSERQQQERPGWFARLLAMEGRPATVARLATAVAVIAAVVFAATVAQRATVSIYNGLATTVQVDVQGAGTRTVGSGQSVDIELAGGEHVIVARLPAGREIESFNARIETSGGHFIYNVAGASALVEWTAVYGNGTPVPPRPLGRSRWLETRVASPFQPPPQQLRSKSGGGTVLVLEGMATRGPDMQLSRVSDAAQARELALVHARFDPLDAPHTLDWLTAASQQAGFAAVLAERLAAQPDNLSLLRLEQDTASPEQRARVCQRQAQRAAQEPDKPDWQYVAIRCIPDGPAHDDAYVAGHQRFPRHAWFAYAAGYVQATRQQWAEALRDFDVVAHESIPLRDQALLEMARMQRMLGGSTFWMDALEQRSEKLSAYLAPEKPVPAKADDSLRGYVALREGQYDQALSLARKSGDPLVSSRMLRLVAASDGAQQQWVSAALALPPLQGLDSSTVWSAIALAMRERRDTSGYKAALPEGNNKQVERVLAFAAAVQAGTAPAQAETLLQGVLPELRGQAYAMALVLQGPRAPEAWRRMATRLLLTVERPHFNAVKE